MNKEQIFTLIESNKITIVRIDDFAGNKLAEVETTSPTTTINELEQLLPNFASYKKLVIRGKKGTHDTPWTNGVKWQFEFDGVQSDSSKIAGLPLSTGIGAQEHIQMVIGMMKENNELTKQLLETKIKAENQDPAKWIPLIEIAAKMFGGQELRAASIAGTENNLQFGDVEKMSNDQISEQIQERLISLSKKINGSDMLKIVISLDDNPNIATQSKDIAIILKALIAKPYLLETALKFI